MNISLPINNGQYDGFSAGGLGSSVNLFRGEVYFDYPLISGLLEKYGLKIYISSIYSSYTDKISRSDNLTAPTGVMGLGWQFGPSFVMREKSNRILPPDQEVFYLNGPRGLSRLYLVENHWLVAKLNADMTKELEKTSVSQELAVNFSKLGVIVTIGSQIIISDDVYTIIDIEGELELCIVAKSLDVYYNAMMFESSNYDFSRIFYFPRFEKWLVIQKDGLRSIYGGSQGNALAYTVHYGGAIIQSDNTNGQSLAVYRWNLAKELNIWDDEINYSYIHETRPVGTGGLEYTRASYLSEITDSIGYKVKIDYGEKLFTTDKKEYIDPDFPYSTIPVNHATPYQSYYETYYLQEMQIIDPDGNMAESIGFEYKIETLFDKSAIKGANSKRLLMSISRQFASEARLPPIQFSYLNDIGTNLGALASVITPTGAKITYKYGQKELGYCSKRNYVIPKDNFANKKIYNGSNYSAIFLYNDAASRFRLYSWVGRFQTWTPPQEPVINDSTKVLALDKCIVLYTKLNNGKITQLQCYRQNPDILGDWTVEVSETFQSKNCQISASEDWLLVCDKDNGKQIRYTYDLKTRKTIKGVSNLSKRHEYFVASKGNNYALLEYDPLGLSGRKTTILSILGLNNKGEWSVLDSMKLPDLVPVADKEKNYALSLSFDGLFCIISSVYRAWASGFDYNLKIMRFDGKLRELYQNNFSVTSGKSLWESADVLWRPEISGQLIVTGSAVFAFDGSRIYENNSLSLANFNQLTGSFFRVVGNNCVIQTQLTEVGDVKHVLARALVYNPAKSNEFKYARPVIIYNERPDVFKEGGYIPTINGNIATFDDRLYDLNRDKPFVPIQILNQCVSNTIINGRNYLLYEDTSKSLQSILIVNGKPMQAIMLNGRLTQAANSPVIFATEHGMDIIIYVYTGNEFDSPVTNYQVDRIEADDGFDVVKRMYGYNNTDVASDNAGRAKYYTVDVYHQENAEGFTRYSFCNSLAKVSPQKNSTAPFATDGQLESTAIYGKNKDILSQRMFTYNFSRSVACHPGGERNVDIYGAIIESAETITNESGVISKLNTSYDAFSGEASQTVTSSYDVEGKKTEITHRFYQATEEYPQLYYQNRLRETSRTIVSWQKDDSSSQIVEAHATVFKPFSNNKRNILIESKELLYKGGLDTDPYGNKPDDWEALSEISKIDIHGNILEREVNGIYQSNYYCKDGHFHIGSVIKMDADEPDVMICTFEDYENIPVLWKENITNEKAVFGSSSLKIPKKSAAASLDLHLSKGEYGVALWSFGDVVLSITGKNVHLKKSACYDIYNITHIVIQDDTDAQLVLRNESDEDAYVDVFSIFQIISPPIINIYKERLLETVVCAYNDFTRQIYNRCRHTIGTINRIGQASIKIPYYKGLAEFNVKSSRYNYDINITFGNFVRYEPISNSNRVINMPEEERRTAAVYVDVEGEGQPSVSLGGATVGFSSGKWKLSINGIVYEAVGKSSDGEWLLIVDRALLFFFNGENVFSVAQDAYFSPLQLILEGNNTYTKLFYGTGVSYGVRFIDSEGQVRQGQMYGDEGITVTQSFYDESRRLIAHTKPAIIGGFDTFNKLMNGR